MAEQPTRDSIIKMLSSKPYDTATFQEIHNILNSDPETFAYISDAIKSLGFDDHHAITKAIYAKPSIGNITSIVKNKIDVEDLPQQEIFSLNELCAKKGIILGQDVLKNLASVKHVSSKLVGKGETLMRVLMKGSESPYGGDILVEGHKIEIKYSKALSASRLRGMTGYPLDASKVETTLDEYFIRECDLVKFDARSLIGTEPGRWNFVSGNKSKLYLLSQILTQSGMAPHKVFQTFVSAFKKYFTRMTDQEEVELIFALSNEHGDYGILELGGPTRRGYSVFIQKLCAFAMRYYARTENFDGMLILNDELYCMYITREYLENNDLSIIATFINDNLFIAPPNLSYKAGPQGSAFGISIS